MAGAHGHRRGKHQLAGLGLRALGLHYGARMLKIVLPQALRVATAPTVGFLVFTPPVAAGLSRAALGPR